MLRTRVCPLRNAGCPSPCSRLGTLEAGWLQCESKLQKLRLLSLFPALERCLGAEHAAVGQALASDVGVCVLCLRPGCGKATETP